MRSLFFIFFFISGFCSLLYQIIWLRLAFASFGIITPVLSVLLSIFMLGIGLGSWVGGRLSEKFLNKISFHPLLVYGLIEIIIGLGAFAVPKFFKISENFLLHFADQNSNQYLLMSALCLGLSIFPWCIMMGATFPVALSYLRRLNSKIQDFSFLYLANVFGAATGAAATAIFLVELFGFSGSLKFAAIANFLVGFAAIGLSLSVKRVADLQQKASENFQIQDVSAFWILFFTGFVSMAMEVIWTRSFTPILQTTIYAFAFLLVAYLLSTLVGTYFYRFHVKRKKVWTTGTLIMSAAFTSLLPLLVNDPRFYRYSFTAYLSLFPFCALLGYLTPKLIDETSNGKIRGIGSAYAVNILGCILGPLVAGYIMLPFLGTKLSQFLLCILLITISIFALKKIKPLIFFGGTLSVLLISIFCITDEDPRMYGSSEIRRDYAATVVAFGEGMEKGLLINGMGITFLTPITKFMAHFPLALRKTTAKNSLMICFGMGTTFRSLYSWGIPVTAVELIPSVRDLFPYYFGEDAIRLLEEQKDNPNSRAKIIIDDGRRFLKRTTEQFDVITLDPPPPVEAAGSSLLYSEEFYELVKSKLSEDGILQQWFPSGETKILNAVARSIYKSFPYVKVFRSYSRWGFHFFASKSPIDIPTSDLFISRLPNAAQIDMMEWFPGEDIKVIVNAILENEKPIEWFLSPDSSISITDDRPFNEYFWLRRYRER